MISIEHNLPTTSSEQPPTDRDSATNSGNTQAKTRKKSIAILVAVCMSAVIMTFATFYQPEIVLTVDSVQASGDALVVTLQWDTSESLGFEIKQWANGPNPDLVFSFNGKGFGSDGMPYPHWFVQILPWVRDWRRASGGPKSFQIPFNKNAPYTWHIQPGDVVYLRPGDDLLLCTYSTTDPDEVMPRAMLEARRR